MSVKVFIEVDERYPDYLISREPKSYHRGSVEVDGRTLRRWERIIAEYDAVMDEIHEVYRQSREADTS